GVQSAEIGSRPTWAASWWYRALLASTLRTGQHRRGTSVSDGLITRGGPMELRLLGEVELRAAGQMLDVGAPRLQAVLAGLAVDAGRPVAIEALIDRVWDDTPPVEVRNVLYSYLSRIRRLLRQAGRAGE